LVIVKRSVHGAAVLTLLASSCRPTPTTLGTEPAVLKALYRERVCSAVVAAYQNGARPSVVGVDLPGPTAADPPAHIFLMAPHILSAEDCLGLAVAPTVAPAALPEATAKPARPVMPLDTRY
jgi:hypothetical protein